MTVAHRSDRPALGIDLGGTKIEALLLDAAGGARWRERVATPQADYAATLAAIEALVARARLAAGAAGCSIGVGGPGSSDPQGRIKNANSTCLNGQPLRQDLERRLGREVRAFAYAKGSELDVRPVHVSLVRQAGYDLGFTSVSGSNRPGTDRFRLRRYNVEPYSTRTFELVLGGACDLIGVKDTVPGTYARRALNAALGTSSA